MAVGGGGVKVGADGVGVAGGANNDAQAVNPAASEAARNALNGWNLKNIVEIIPTKNE